MLDLKAWGPTVVEVPRDSWIWTTELFVPLIAVEAVDSLDEAFTLANATPLGLTAGMFSAEPTEVDQFLDRIERLAPDLRLAPEGRRA